jgi:hypothetical protein
MRRHSPNPGGDPQAFCGVLSPAAENGLIKRFSGVYGSAGEMGGTGLEPVTPSLSSRNADPQLRKQVRPQAGLVSRGAHWVELVYRSAREIGRPGGQ